MNSYQYGGELAQFVDFNLNKDKKVHLDNFYTDLKYFGDRGDLTCKKLHEILTTKNNFHVNFWESSQGVARDCVLVMLKGKNDFILNKLAKETYFPRGFPIIWKKDTSVDMFGFYPKFENDDREESPTDDKDFENVSEINFNFKYSGFLGQIVPFEHLGNKLWTTCSKNGTSNKFSGWAKDLISPKMTVDYVTTLIAGNNHFCGEVMSRFDQVHGARVLQENLVVTAVGTGHHVKKGDDEAIIQTGHVYTEGTNYFITFKNQGEMREFCLEGGLAIDSIYQVRDGVRGSITKKFLTNLSGNRNYMNLTNFNTLWTAFTTEYPDNTDDKEGNIRHIDVLGNVLEGLIIKLKYSDEKDDKTVKYKFPFYTIRTMFLRAFLGNYGTLASPSAYFIELADYVDRWVVGDLGNKGKQYWAYLGTLILKNYFTWKTEHDAIADVVESGNSTKYGLHIHIVDKLSQLAEFTYNVGKDYSALHEASKEEAITVIEAYLDTKPVMDMVLILGPIGSGKSSIGQEIEKADARFRHIDGDILNLTGDEVLALKGERNPYTRWQIVKCVIDGKIPVVSMGGGALLGGGKKRNFDLNQDLIVFFGPEHKFKVTVLLPLDTEEFSTEEDISHLIDNFKQKTTHPTLKKVESLYKNKPRFDQALANRAERGTPMGGNPGKLFSISIKNFGIAETICKDLHAGLMLKGLHYFPIINPTNRATVLPKVAAFTATKLNTHQVKNIVPGDLKFTQKRILARYVLEGTMAFHHITMEYSNDSQIAYAPLHVGGVDKAVPGKLYEACEVKPLRDFSNQLNSLVNATKGKARAVETVPAKFTEAITAAEGFNTEFSALSDLQKCNKYLTSPSDFRKVCIDINKAAGMLHGILSKQGKKGKPPAKLDVGEVATIAFIVVDLSSVAEYPEELKKRAHITVDAGAHYAAAMKDATLFVNSLLDGSNTTKFTLTLPGQKGSKSRTYVMGENTGDLAMTKNSDVPVTLRSIFFMHR